MQFNRIAKQKKQRNGAIATGSATRTIINRTAVQTDVIIDSALSQTSVNPVANSVVTNALTRKIDKERLINSDGTLQITVSDPSVCINSSTWHYDSAHRLYYDGNVHVGTLDASTLTASDADISTGHLTTANIDTLNVTGAAHFFKLVVDELKSTSGAVVITSANCVVDMVASNNYSYTTYFRATDADGHRIVNSWRVGD